MPHPIELLLDPVALVVFGLYGGLMVLEALRPARTLPLVRAWRIRGLVAFLAFFFLSSYLPLFWDDALARFQLLDLTGLGAWGAAVGVLVYEAGVYGWHRALHGSSVLWRGFHQMHHSAERLDTYGAFWFSPLDMVGWTALSSLCLVLVVGLTPEAATWVIYVTTFLGIFQHANVRTPRWLGYVIQRPESHSLHHERGKHTRNFSDLPVFDLLFGTFHNPPTFAPEQGFYEGGSSRVGDMVLFRDINPPPMPVLAGGNLS